jgi:hypothetical protein
MAVLLTATAVAAFAVSGVFGRGDAYLGDGVDVYGTFWFYWWIERCLSLGESPGFTDLMFHPSGKDIFAHTGGNFVDAALSIPFQWALGSPGFQPWFYGAIVVGNGLSMIPLARHVLKAPVAVWVSSSLWALNPFCSRSFHRVDRLRRCCGLCRSRFTIFFEPSAGCEMASLPVCIRPLRRGCIGSMAGFLRLHWLASRHPNG